jgi:hypothetical protein
MDFVRCELRETGCLLVASFHLLFIFGGVRFKSAPALFK